MNPIAVKAFSSVKASVHARRENPSTAECRIAQHPAAQLPWGHILVLLDRLPDPSIRDWYAGQAAHNGWSRATLVHHITTGRHLRVGAAPNNFPPTTLPAQKSDLTHAILEDP